MSSAISFPSRTDVFDLPLLFAGQAQKEFTINQSLGLIDIVLQKSIWASSSSPPQDAQDGASFRVMDGASGEWAGHVDEIAVRIGGAWSFISPYPGLSLFDRGQGAIVHFDSTWRYATEPSEPNGGSVIDTEARQALSELVEALRKVGIFPGDG